MQNSICLSERNETSLAKNDVMTTSEWYTIEQLSSFTGLGKDRLNQLLPSLCNQLQSEKTVKSIGKSHQKIYSDNILKALKQYQLKNSTPNSLKNKDTAIDGNISFVQQTTVKQTIDNLLDNPDTLNMLLSESLARNKALGIENKQLKEVISNQQPKVDVYDSISDSATLQDLQTAAVTIGIKNIFKILEADGIIEKKTTNDGQAYYKPIAKYAEYLALKDGKAWTDPYGVKHVRPRIFVTGKGLLWLTKKYGAEK